MNSATNAMLDGIKEACEAWGRAMRWVLTAEGEGYPSMATFERAREGELDAKAIKGIRQRFGEVLLGDALAVSRAIRGEPLPPPMPELLHKVIFMHYVVPKKDARRRPITIEMKSREIGIDGRRSYYLVHDNAMHFLLARIPIGASVSHETICAGSVHTAIAM